MSKISESLFVTEIQQHQGIIHKVCNMYCDDAEDRKDLFQEILLQLWRAFPSFRQEAKMTTWMYRVALNTAISRLRKQKRKPENTALSISELQIADTPIDTEKEEQLVQMHKAIAQLNKIEKAIMMLYLEDKSYDEIAEIIGITKNHVGVKINRIKIKLKSQLEAQNI
ncbi:MAG: sigma-70 family RNA polymerase sigma factor [Bernardetiaceae bacterium]|nr:sigma-70 family RNA polymerase sigma factor [Bernardetiaceae bacterium]